MFCMVITKCLNSMCTYTVVVKRFICRPALYEAVVPVILKSHDCAVFVSLLNNLVLFNSLCRTLLLLMLSPASAARAPKHTDSTNRANTVTHVDPKLTQKVLARYRQTELYTHTHY